MAVPADVERAVVSNLEPIDARPAGNSRRPWTVERHRHSRLGVGVRPQRPTAAFSSIDVELGQALELMATSRFNHRCRTDTGFDPEATALDL